MKVKISSQTGKFNFVNPSDKTTELRISIPKFDYSESFTFEPGGVPPGIEDWSWDEVIDWVLAEPYEMRTFLRTGRRLEELEELYKYNRESIRESWIRGRLNEINNNMKELQAEEAELKAEIGQ